MSKAELIELIKLDDYDLKDWLYTVGVDEARGVFINALKEQDRDTRHGCAGAVINSDVICETPAGNDAILVDDAHAACLNYQDKDLAGVWPTEI